MTENAPPPETAEPVAAPSAPLAPSAHPEDRALEAAGPEPAPAPPAVESHVDDDRGPTRGAWIQLAVVATVSAAADLASKGWATHVLQGFDPAAKVPKRLEVIPGFFDVIFTLNPGGAWSFLRGLPEYYRRPFFLFVSAAAMVFMVHLFARTGHRLRGMRWGLPLALGGAFGNLVDRARYGSVVDFLDLYVKRGGGEHHWPTFNVADVAIVIGVLLMAVDMLIGARDEARAEARRRAAPAGQDAPQA